MKDEIVSDYAGFDFRSLWTGRGGVTKVERAVVRLALDGCDRARVLEIGSGYGRMTPELLGHDGEVVVSDYDVGALESMELPPVHPPPAL
ncbi:MAG: hypothetical protein ACYDFT_05790, partial [Thermoplasmata archaeon]